jgi:hypothetical protein
MSFRTLLMLAVAALIVVVAVKMNRPATDYEAPEEAAVEGMATESPVADEATNENMMEEEATIEQETGVTVEENGTVIEDEALTEEEADAMEPAVTEESPAEELETGPAEVISDEPVDTPEK